MKIDIQEDKSSYKDDWSIEDIAAVIIILGGGRLENRLIDTNIDNIDWLQ